MSRGNSSGRRMRKTKGGRKHLAARDSRRGTPRTKRRLVTPGTTGTAAAPEPAEQPARRDPARRPATRPNPPKPAGHAMTARWEARGVMQATSDDILDIDAQIRRTYTDAPEPLARLLAAPLVAARRTLVDALAKLLGDDDTTVRPKLLAAQHDLETLIPPPDNDRRHP